MEIYSPKSLNSTESQFINEVSQKLKQEIMNFTGRLDVMKRSVATFQETLDDYVNCSIERADILNKYYYDDQYQSHTPFPGVVQLPKIADINETKSDQERVAEILEVLDKADDQKNITQRMMQDDFEQMVNTYKKMVSLFQSLGEGVAAMNSELNIS